VLDNMSLMMRGLGMAAFVSATALSAFVMARSDAAVLRWLLAAAAVAVVIHGQSEMSFHYAGSVVWAMCALGVAAAKPSVSARATRMGAAALIGLLASMSVVIGLGSASVQGSERLLDASADQLRSVSGDSAGRCEARIRVGSLVSGLSNQHYSMDARLPLAAAQQFELAARECDPSQRAALLEQAVDTLERAMERFDRQAILAAAVDAHARLAALNNDQSHWNRAIELATDLTRLDPHGIASWRNLGDILWAAGRTTEAAAAYQHALQNNANFELDELKQLSDKDSEGLRARIDRVRSSPSDAGSP
jgi:predicted negative regulator of RcsB-dependent stress response